MPNAPVSNGKFGASVAGIPDRDGDSVGDFAVGAPGEASTAGTVHVFSGFSGQRAFVLTSPTPNAANSGNFGRSVAGIRDLDGDGFGDIIVGAPNEKTPPTTTISGRVHVFSGRLGSPIRSIDIPVAESLAGFGSAVASVPDINGDGRDEIVVGAAFGGDIGAGTAYLFDGATGTLLRSFSSPALLPSAKFGASVAGLHDSAGAPAVLIGAPWEGTGAGYPSQAGRSYLFSAVDGSLIRTVSPVTPRTVGEYGAAVAGLGDINNDDIDDYAIGAPKYGSSGIDTSGRVFVYSGQSGALLFSLAATTTPTGTKDFGFSVAGGVDLNGDACPDIVVGARREPIGGVTANGGGRSYAFSGSSGQVFQTFDSGAYVSLGEFGCAVSVVNGPFITDRGVVVGAESEGGNGTPASSGRAYSFLVADCNGNGIRDSIDVSSGGIQDCDGNGRPDTCDTNGYFADCNGNQIQDACDIAAGTSSDSNADGVPDECADCLVSIDCNGNGIADESELIGNDCDGNGIPDDCEVNTPLVERVSVVPQGATDFTEAYDADMSADRRYIAFYGSRQSGTNVYVRDRQTGTIENVHVAPGGVAANGPAYGGIDMTPDARFVAFTSDATNIVPGAPFGQSYLHDRINHSSELVAIGIGGAMPDGNTYSPVISGDGRYVAFWSWATNLVVGDSNARADVFRRDRQTGQTIRVSVSSSGVQGNNDSGLNRGTSNLVFTGSRQVAISDDGRYVAFGSDSTNLVSNDTNAARDLFVHDCVQHDTRRVDIASDGAQANAGSNRASTGYSYPASIDMTPDGRFIVFESISSNLFPMDPNNAGDIFVHDRLNHRTERIAVPGATPAGLSFNPAISADGCFVAFSTSSRTVVSGQQSSAAFDVIRYDRRTGIYELASRQANGVGGNKDSGALPGTNRISTDGQWVLFASNATNLAGSASAKSQIFLFAAFGGRDCNANGTPDVCDAGFADCNGNGIADTCECGCPGDANGDRRVDGRDVAAFVGCMLSGCSPIGCGCSDQDGNGITDTNDLVPFVMRLSTSSGACP